jgi:hypothetical protein
VVIVAHCLSSAQGKHHELAKAHPVSLRIGIGDPAGTKWMVLACSD